MDSDFLLVVIELFSLGAMAETLRVNIDSKSAFFKGVDQFGPKFQVEGYIPHRPFVHGYIGQLMPYKLCG